jgi:2-polyprenyl-3-methyl-5-hydroxy-6-metoxy-1,4-benzoquinol methylase
MREAETDEQEQTLARPDVHAEWASDYRSAANQPFYDQCFDRILTGVGAPVGSTFLDAGCGSCSHSIRLAKRGYMVEAVDFSDTVLALARQNVADERLSDRINVRQANLRALPYADAEFSYVLCWGVLMHVPDIDAAVAELSRVIAPGGTLIVQEGNMNAVQPLAHRALLRLTRRPRKVTRSEAGIEKWKDTEAGKVMTREARIPWLISAFEQRGLQLQSRTSGEFTIAYVRVSSSAVRRAIHALNSMWFRHGRLPGLAFTNVLVFRRTS